MNDRKNKKLTELCQLVSDVGVANAVRLKQRLEQTLDRFGYTGLDSRVQSLVLHHFICMNFALINGVWSNLENASLRRDLLAESLQAFVLKSVSFWTQSQDIDDRAYTAVLIQEEIQRFWKTCLERMKKIEADGMTVNGNAVFLYTLELVKSHLNLSDARMK